MLKEEMMSYRFPADLPAILAVTVLLALAGCTNARFGGPTLASTDTSVGTPAAATIERPKGIGAAIGVDLGVASGYLIGAQREKFDTRHAEEARSAAERARVAPATVEDARRSDSADLNGDGFVTVDEIVAMEKIGLSDREMIDRLQRTGQAFILTEQQQDYLRDRGVSQRVISAMIAMDLGHSNSTNSTSGPTNADG